MNQKVFICTTFVLTELYVYNKIFLRTHHLYHFHSILNLTLSSSSSAYDTHAYKIKCLRLNIHTPVTIEDFSFASQIQPHSIKRDFTSAVHAV